MKQLKLSTLILGLLIGLQFQGWSQTSLWFDGADDYVEAPNDPIGIIGTGDFTFEAWISGRESIQPDHPPIISSRDVVGQGVIFFFHEAWGGSPVKMLCLQIGGVNYFLLNNGAYGGSILDGNCHHVAVSKNGTLLSFYVDGNHIGDKTIPAGLTIETPSPTLFIGKDNFTTDHFLGDICEVRIWNSPRTQADIAASMNVAIPGTTTNLLAYWRHDDGTGQVTTDIAGGFNGARGGTLAPQSSDPEWNPWGCGLPDPDSGLYFDGNDDYVTIPTDPLNAIWSKEFTMEAWVKGEESLQTPHPTILSNRLDPIASGEGMILFFHDNWGGSFCKMLCLQIGGVNYFLMNNGSFNASILDGTCHHVAVTKTHDQIHFYVDGGYIGTRNLVAPLYQVFGSSSAEMYIGNDLPTGNHFEGTISEMRIWYYPQSAADISSNLNTVITPGTPGIRALWKMNEGTGQVVTEVVASADGVLGSNGSVEGVDPSWTTDVCDAQNDFLRPVQEEKPALADRVTALNLDGLNVSPNPTSGQIRFEFAEFQKDITITIYDLNGKIVMMDQSKEQIVIQLNIENLDPGMYIAHVQLNDRRIIRKIEKN